MITKEEIEKLFADHVKGVPDQLTPLSIEQSDEILVRCFPIAVFRSFKSYHPDQRELIAYSIIKFSAILAKDLILENDALYNYHKEHKAFKTALEKINDIRNSIVGYHSINWSAHIYPLVAALEEAGIKGMGYEKAREMAKTQLDRIAALEKENYDLKVKIKDNLPSECIMECELKFCFHRNGDGWSCKKCATLENPTA